MTEYLVLKRVGLGINENTYRLVGIYEERHWWFLSTKVKANHGPGHYWFIPSSKWENQMDV